MLSENNRVSGIWGAKSSAVVRRWSRSTRARGGACWQSSRALSVRWWQPRYVMPVTNHSFSPSKRAADCTGRGDKSN